jgi:uroporphyrinogen-III synthase
VLPGSGVIITRPAAQAHALARLIAAIGGRAILFPALEILERPPLPESRAAIEDADIAIFISANAVEFGLRFAQTPLPKSVKLAAIGKMTAQALRAAGYEDIIMPQSGADSAALLANPALQRVSGKRVVVFRGVGGRETLRDVLCQRGAKVAYIECYKRRQPEVAARDLEELTQRKDIAAIHFLSRETLHNFCNLIGPNLLQTLRQKPVFAPHSAILDGARMLGFDEGVLTDFGDEGLIAALEQRFGTTP